MRSISIAILVLGLTSTVMHAQSDGAVMSDEEMSERIQGQLTRGLTITAGGGNTQAADTGTGTTVTPQADDAVRVADDLEINIRIQFEFDSAALAASEQPALQQMCRVMRQANEVKLFQIVGHTDSAGSEAYNQRLSKLRADEVGRYLVNDCGIAASRLQMVGYGEQFPDNQNDPSAPENRRVELQVLG